MKGDKINDIVSKTIVNPRKNVTDGISKYHNELMNIATEPSKKMREGIENALKVMRVPYQQYAENLQSIMAMFRAIGFKESEPIKYFAENQFVCWHSDDFVRDEIKKAENIDDCITSFYKDYCLEEVENGFKNFLEKDSGKRYESLLKQSLLAIEENQFDLGIMGLLAIIDSLLSDATLEYENTNLKNRIKKLIDKAGDKVLDSNRDLCAIHSLTDTLLSSVETLGDSISFLAEEPQTINRHWIMHGRRRVAISKLDCIKVISILYGIILMQNVVAGADIDGRIKYENRRSKNQN